MNLATYSKVAVPSYLSFEFDNNTYSIMDVEEKDYDSIYSKTDFTKQSKALIWGVMTLAIISNPLYASLEKEKFDNFDSLTPSIIEQKSNLSSNYSPKSKTWIDDFLINANNLNTAKDLFPYYSKINNLMIEKKFKNYNEILEKVEVEKINETLIIALLRLSFIWKDEINSWNQFLEKSIVALENKGHDSKKLLIGLI